MSKNSGYMKLSFFVNVLWNKKYRKLLTYYVFPLLIESSKVIIHINFNVYNQIL